MALVQLSGPALQFPDIPAVGNPPTFGSDTVSSGTPKKAFIFRIPKTGTLDKVELWFRAVATAQDVKISFQDIDPATGNPDGVVDQFRVIPSASVSGTGWKVPGLITSDGTDSGTKRSVTIGDTLCAVVEFDSTVGSIGVGVLAKNSSVLGTNGLAFDASYNGSAWSRGNDYPILILKYDDGTYVSPGPWILPAIVMNTRTYNSSSTPDERGLSFSLPWDVGVTGAWVATNLTGDASIVLYDSDGTTVLRSVALDKDTDVNAVSVAVVSFASQVTLTANTTYRLTVLPTSTTNLSMYEWGVNAAALMAGFPGGTSMIGTTRTDAGAWTADDTARPMMGLLISAINTTSTAEREHAFASVG